MINLSRRSVTVLCGLLASLSLVPGTAHTAAALTVAQALADAPAADWRSPAPEQTVVMTLPGGRQVLIELAPGFAPRHTRQIAQLVHAGWYDGLAIARVATQPFGTENRLPLTALYAWSMLDHVQFGDAFAAQFSAKLTRLLQGRKVDVLLTAPNLMHLPIHEIAFQKGQKL